MPARSDLWTTRGNAGTFSRADPSSRSSAQNYDNSTTRSDAMMFRLRTYARDQESERSFPRVPAFPRVFPREGCGQ